MIVSKLNKAAEIHQELASIEKWMRQIPEETILNLIALMDLYEPGYSKDYYIRLQNKLVAKLKKRKQELLKEMEKL